MEALERMHLLLRRLSPDCGKELVGLGEKNSQQVEISSRLCNSLKNTSKPKIPGQVGETSPLQGQWPSFSFCDKFSVPPRPFAPDVFVS